MTRMKSQGLILFLTSFYTFLFLPLAPLWAQGLVLPSDMDLSAPAIKHKAISKEIEAGEALTLKASITDNVGVEEVTLFYRKAGERNYSSINMESLGNNTYSTVIPKEEIIDPGFEYYIQAADKAGNTALRGFSFSPLEIVVLSPLSTPKKEEEPLVQKTPSPEDEANIMTAEVVPPREEPFALRTETTLKKPWYKKWWVWAIAVGVVAGAAAGGGGGGAPAAGAPATGTAIIAGPLP